MMNERIEFEIELNWIGLNCRYYPKRKRLMRYFESVVVTTGMLIVALIFMICSLNLQVGGDNKEKKKPPPMYRTASRLHRTSPASYIEVYV